MPIPHDRLVKFQFSIAAVELNESPYVRPLKESDKRNKGFFCEHVINYVILKFRLRTKDLSIFDTLNLFSSPYSEACYVFVGLYRMYKVPYRANIEVTRLT